MAFDFGPGLLERGTGASYLSQGELGNLEIPYALATIYGRCFRVYAGALQRRCFATMQRVEAEVRDRLVH